MDSLALATLAVQLLASIHSLSGYPTPEVLPEIHQAPLAQAGIDPIEEQEKLPSDGIAFSR